MSYPLATYLESLARANIAAINSRDFSPTSALLTTKTKTYLSEARTATNNHEMNLPDFVHSLQKYVERYPDFKVRIVDMQTSIDEKNGFAEMFLRTEVTGNPVGLFKRSVTIVLYRRVEGCWLSDGHRAVPGSEVGGGE